MATQDDDSEHDNEDIRTDDYGRDFIIVHGSRYHYKDYTLTLNDKNVNLLRFVVLTDCTSKRECFIAPRDYLGTKEGVVYWPAHVRPSLKKALFLSFYETLVKNEVPRSTLVFPFNGVNYKLAWKPIAIKAVYRDFDDFQSAEEYIDREGNIADKCSTIPDKDMALREIESIRTEKREPVPRKRSFVNDEELSLNSKTAVQKRSTKSVEAVVDTPKTKKSQITAETDGAMNSDEVVLNMDEGVGLLADNSLSSQVNSEESSYINDASSSPDAFPFRHVYPSSPSRMSSNNEFSRTSTPMVELTRRRSTVAEIALKNSIASVSVDIGKLTETVEGMKGEIKKLHKKVDEQNELFRTLVKLLSEGSGPSTLLRTSRVGDDGRESTHKTPEKVRVKANLGIPLADLAAYHRLEKLIKLQQPGETDGYEDAMDNRARIDHLLNTYSGNSDLYAFFSAIFHKNIVDTVSIVQMKNTEVYQLMKSKISGWNECLDSTWSVKSKNKKKNEDETEDDCDDVTWQGLSGNEKFDILLRQCGYVPESKRAEES